MIVIMQEAVKELSTFEKWIDGIDLGIKFFGGVVIILGAWLSFRQYADQREKEAQDYQDQKNREMAQRQREAAEDRQQRQRELNQREQELRIKVFDREMDLYSRASTAASRIAIAAEKMTRNESAETEFWELYWGSLCIIETPTIEAAMVRLGDALQRRDKAEREKAQKQQDAAQQHATDLFQENAAAEELKELSYALAQEIRAFLKTQYKGPRLKNETP